MESNRNNVAIIIFMHVCAYDELAKHVPCSLSDYVC